MAEDLKAQIVIEAQDRATGIIRGIAGELGVFGDEITRIASIASPAAIAIAGIGAAFGGITVVGLKLAEQVEQLDKLSVRTGVSAEKLQILQQAIKEAGGDVGSLTTALTFLNRSIAQGDPLLEQLGLKGLTAGDAFIKLSDIFGRSGDTAKKAEIAMQLMGRGAGDLIGIMPELAAKVDEVGSSMKELNGVFTDETLKAARELDKQADQLGRTWTSMMNSMRAATLPIALEIVGALADIFNAMHPTASGTASAREREIARLQEQGAALRQMASESAAAGTPQFSRLWDEDADKVERRLAEMGAAVSKSQQQMMDSFAAIAKLDFGDPLKNVKTTKAKDDLSEFEKQVLKLREAMKLSEADAREYVTRLKEIADAKTRLSVEKELGLVPQMPADADATEQRIRDIVTTLHKGRAEAIAAQAAFNSMLDADKARKMALELGFLTQEELDYNEMVLEGVQVLGLEEGAARRAANAQRDRAEAAKKSQVAKKLGIELEPDPDKVKAATDSWRKALEDIYDAGVLTKTGLDALFNGMQAGFSAAFNQIVAGTGTFKSVMTALFKSLVDEVLAQLARIAASKVLLMLIDLISGGTGTAAIPLGTARGSVPGVSPPPPIPNLTVPVPEVFITVPPLPDLPTPEVNIAAPPLPPAPEVSVSVPPLPDLPAPEVNIPPFPDLPEPHVSVTVAPPVVEGPAPMPEPADMGAAAAFTRALGATAATLGRLQPPRPVAPAPAPTAQAVGVGALQRALVGAVAGATLTRGQVSSIASAAASIAASAQARAQARMVEVVRAATPKEQQPVPTTITNVQVLGYDNHSIVQDITSPTGKLRAANARTSFMGAY